VIEIFNASQDTFTMCKGVKAVVDSSPSLCKYVSPILVSKFGFGHPIRHKAFLKSALDDMEYLVNNMSAFKDPLYSGSLEFARREVVCVYYMIAEGTVSEIFSLEDQDS